MKAQPIKSVQINFGYSTTHDLTYIFDQLRRELSNGSRNVKASIRGFEYSLKVFDNELLKIKQTPPLQTKINGIDSLVYRSSAWDNVTKKQIDNLKLK